MDWTTVDSPTSSIVVGGCGLEPGKGGMALPTWRALVCPTEASSGVGGVGGIFTMDGNLVSLEPDGDGVRSELDVSVEGSTAAVEASRPGFF